MHSLRSGPSISGLSQRQCHPPLIQCARELCQKQQPRKYQWTHKSGFSGPFAMQSQLLPWWQCRWRFWSSGSLDECVQLHHAHFIHKSQWLKRCSWYRFLQMRVKDRFSHRPSLDLQVPFLLSSAISLSPLQSLLVLRPYSPMQNSMN